MYPEASGLFISMYFYLFRAISVLLCLLFTAYCLPCFFTFYFILFTLYFVLNTFVLCSLLHCSLSFSCHSWSYSCYTWAYNWV